MRGPLTTLLSVEARVCAEPSRLCLRIQHWVIFRTRRRDSVLRKLECVTICNHLRLHNGTAFPALIESSFDAYSAGAGRAYSPEVCQCRPCDLDFQLEFPDLGGIGMALVVTKWLDLGRGLGIETNVHRGGSQRIGPSGRFVRARSRTHYSMPGRRASFSVRKGRGVVTGGSLSPEQGTSDQPKVQGDDGSLERENVGPASWSACALVLPIASPTTLGLRAWRPCLAILWQVFRET